MTHTFAIISGKLTGLADVPTAEPDSIVKAGSGALQLGGVVNCTGTTEVNGGVLTLPNGLGSPAERRRFLGGVDGWAGRVVAL